MHICYINMPIEYYSPTCGGAVSTVMVQQANELLMRGHRVSVLTITNEQETYKVGRVLSIRKTGRQDLTWMDRRIAAIQTRMKRWDWPNYGPYLSSVRARLNELSPAPDAVIVHNDLVMPKYLRQWLPKTKIVVLLHNEQRTNQKSMAQTIAATDAFAAVSDYIAKWTRDAHKVPNAKVQTLQNGVDLEAFSPAKDSEQKQWDGLRVLYLGRIDPNKGPDIAADAVRQLREEGVNISISWAGPVWWHGENDSNADPYFRELKTKMEAAQARYLGHLGRAEVPAAIRANDVVCVLSRSNEPFGLVALEAMACGCAVIASNRGGLPEACGGAAILVDPDDRNSVVAALRKLATDNSYLAEMKRQSLARAASASWAVNVDKLESILQNQAGTP